MSQRGDSGDEDSNKRGKIRYHKAIDRRPVRFWDVFNAWWRAHYKENGQRPSANEIETWYDENHETAWAQYTSEKHPVPSVDDTKAHAKSLRTTDSIRNYFRAYRARQRTEGYGAMCRSSAGGGKRSSYFDEDDFDDMSDTDEDIEEHQGDEGQKGSQGRPAPTPAVKTRRASHTNGAALGHHMPNSSVRHVPAPYTSHPAVAHKRTAARRMSAPPMAAMFTIGMTGNLLEDHVLHAHAQSKGAQCMPFAMTAGDQTYVAIPATTYQQMAMGSRSPLGLIAPCARSPVPAVRVHPVPSDPAVNKPQGSSASQPTAGTPALTAVASEPVARAIKDEPLEPSGLAVVGVIEPAAWPPNLPPPASAPVLLLPLSSAVPPPKQLAPNSPTAPVRQAPIPERTAVKAEPEEEMETSMGPNLLAMSNLYDAGLLPVSELMDEDPMGMDGELYTGGGQQRLPLDAEPDQLAVEREGMDEEESDHEKIVPPAPKRIAILESGVVAGAVPLGWPRVKAVSEGGTPRATAAYPRDSLERQGYGPNLLAHPGCFPMPYVQMGSLPAGQGASTMIPDPTVNFAAAGHHPKQGFVPIGMHHSIGPSYMYGMPMGYYNVPVDVMMPQQQFSRGSKRPSSSHESSPAAALVRRPARSSGGGAMSTNSTHTAHDVAGAGASLPHTKRLSETPRTRDPPSTIFAATSTITAMHRHNAQHGQQPPASNSSPAPAMSPLPARHGGLPLDLMPGSGARGVWGADITSPGPSLLSPPGAIGGTMLGHGQPSLPVADAKQVGSSMAAMDASLREGTGAVCIITTSSAPGTHTAAAQEEGMRPKWQQDTAPVGLMLCPTRGLGLQL